MSELTDSQKIEETMHLVGALKEQVDVLCNAVQTLVDKLPELGLPKRPTATQPTKQPTPQPTQTTQGKMTLEDARMLFPEDVEARLDFQLRDQGTLCIIKPKQFLGTEMFAKIAQTIKANGGEYVSAGRDSHFRLPLKKDA